MNSEGVGLGLLISKQLIENNGGKLEIHSDGIDRGSVFAFSMGFSPASLNEYLSSSYSSDSDKDLE